MSNEELAAAIQRGEREKLPQLWAQVERFVLKHAHRWALALDGAGGITADDLAQAGYLAMAEAVGRFDPEAGGAFMTVLWYALKQEFTQAAGLRTKRERKDPLRLAASLDIPATDEEDGEPLEALIAGPQAEQDFETIEAKQLHDALENALHSLTVVQLAVPVLPGHDPAADSPGAGHGAERGAYRGAKGAADPAAPVKQPDAAAICAVILRSGNLTKPDARAHVNRASTFSSA